jgi:hypothetical protein
MYPESWSSLGRCFEKKRQVTYTLHSNSCQNYPRLLRRACFGVFYAQNLQKEDNFCSQQDSERSILQSQTHPEVVRRQLSDLFHQATGLHRWISTHWIILTEVITPSAPRKKSQQLKHALCGFKTHECA